MKHIQIVRVPWSWPLLSWGDAGYYGRRWALTIGPLIIFLWQMTEEQYGAWADKFFGKASTS